MPISSLAIIIDMSTRNWDKYITRCNQTNSIRNNESQHHTINYSKENSFIPFLDQLFIFIKAYLLINIHNKYSIIICNINKSYFLFNSEDKIKLTKYLFVNKIIEQLSNIKNITKKSNSNLISAISLGTCYINRFNKNNIGNLLIFCFSKGNNYINSFKEYTSFMNCIFALQNLNVTLNVCCFLNDNKSLGEFTKILQGSSKLLKGVFLKIDNINSLSQYLLTIIIPNLTEERNKFPIAYSNTDDFKTFCFCHFKFIDTGFVCPKCLAVHCKKNKKCIICETNFK